jgi:ATP-dependent DNA helicase RecQ
MCLEHDISHQIHISHKIPIFTLGQRFQNTPMTRAISRLEIHYNGEYLDSIRAENIEVIEDNTPYAPPDELVVQLTHKHVQLGYFTYVEGRVQQLKTGESMKLNEEGCQNQSGDQVLNFSTHMKEKIQALQQLGYTPSTAKVAFLVYWYDEKQDKEVLVVLPGITFLKKP